MYDPYIVRRTQIYIEEDQHRRLAVRAAEEGTTASALIRRAIDGLLLDGSDRDRARDAFRQALVDLRGQPPVGLLPGERYVEELRAADAARVQETGDDAR